MRLRDRWLLRIGWDELGESVPLSGAVATATVMVTNLSDFADGDLAGVLWMDPEGLVVGGFASNVDRDGSAVSETVMQPGDLDASEPANRGGAAWPHLTDEPAMLEPGRYTLMLWATPSSVPTADGCPSIPTATVRSIQPLHCRHRRPKQGCSASQNTTCANG